MLSFLSTEGSPHEVITYRRVVDAGPLHRRSDAAVSHVMQFVPKQDEALQAAIEGFGCVEVGACPANRTLEPAPDKVHKCFDNNPFVFTLTTADREKTPCSVGGDIVQSFLRPRPPIPGPSIKAAVNDEENGQYKVLVGRIFRPSSIQWPTKKRPHAVLVGRPFKPSSAPDLQFQDHPSRQQSMMRKGSSTG